MEFAILRTLAGFLNKDGGTLIVGVSDDGSPLGVETDHFENEDKMALHLTNIVNRSIGAVAWLDIHANFDDYEDGRVLVVRCKKASSPVYVKDKKTDHFFIRTGPSTTELPTEATVEYINQRFK